MEKSNGFEHFDVVSDDSDHYFLGSNEGKCFNDSNSGVYSTIMREWRILEKNLPDTIYVRVHERRIDLMRAVIVGAAGTPYHDGLFFFDIALPSDYPKIPPKLHFHSFGQRLNPNLYSNGKVCLSLLNTWHGKKREMWDPSGSTMLQVLLSIQGLVLNEKPFFNEPGAEAFARFLFETRSRVYNQNAFAITCKISFYLLQRPPRNFQAFVRSYFRERAFPILDACNEYVSGRVRVGDYYSCELRSSKVEVSREFKNWMVQFYPLLVEAFRRNGASLGSFVERLELERDDSENKTSEQRDQSKSKSKSGGIFKKVVEKIKRAFLEWKKKS